MRHPVVDVPIKQVNTKSLGEGGGVEIPNNTLQVRSEPSKKLVEPET